MKILQDKPNSIQTLLLLATAKFQLKQAIEAKQIMLKITRNFEDAEKILKNAFLYNKNNG